MSELTSLSSTPDDEIDLLDLLLVVVENLKLLIVIPVIAALAGWGIAYVLPQTYESQSSVSLPVNTTVSPEMLASLLRSHSVLTQAGIEAQVAPELSKQRLMKKMEQLVSVSVGKQDKIITLITRGKTPEAAQFLNETVWKWALPRTIPQGNEMERLATQLSAEKERLSSGSALEASTAKLLQNGASAESSARLYGELLASNSKRLEKIAELESQIQGITLDNLIQTPILPEDPIKPKKAIIAVATGLVAGFLVLLFIFARHALRSASRNPEQADKVLQLRKALGMRI